MSSRDEYIRKLQAKLDDVNTELDLLTDKAAKVSVHVRDEFNQHIESLKARRSTARERMEELQQSGEGAWEDLKSGVELSWIAMGEAIDSARSRFR